MRDRKTVSLKDFGGVPTLGYLSENGEHHRRTGPKFVRMMEGADTI